MRSFLVRVFSCGALYHIPLTAMSAIQAEFEALTRFPAGAVAMALEDAEA